MVQLGGVEPPTSCSTDRRSNQLSYSCTTKSRGSYGETAPFSKPSYYNSFEQQKAPTRSLRSLPSLRFAGEGLRAGK